jgi:hypothetical protein
MRLASGMTAAVLAVWAGLAGAAGPRLDCEKEWAFGTVPNHREVEHVFRLGNTGDAPLVVERIRVCCGATYALTAETIPAGGSADLRIRLSLAGRMGPQKKSIYVISNDPVAPYFQIQLTGTATAELQAIPDRIDFGNLDETAAAEQAARVTSVTGGVFQVTNAVASAGWMTVAWEPDASGTGGTVRVRTKPPLPPGALAGRVTLLTDLPDYPRLELPAGVRVDSEVVVVPPAILLRPGAGSGGVRYVALRRRGGKPFKLLDVETPEKGIRAEVSALGANGYRVAVSGIGAGAGLDGKFLTLHTDMAGMEEVEVPFRLEKESE